MTDLLFDEHFVGMMNKFVDDDHLVPATFAAVVLHDETQYHDGLDHQLTILRLSDLIEDCFNLQRELDLAGSHLQQQRYQLSKVDELLYTPLLLVHDCDQPTTVTSSSHTRGPLSLAAAVSACADQQFGTNLHRICEAQTLGNSLSIVLTAGYLSVHTAGGASDSC